MFAAGVITILVSSNYQSLPATDRVGEPYALTKNVSVGTRQPPSVVVRTSDEAVDTTSHATIVAIPKDTAESPRDCDAKKSIATQIAELFVRSAYVRPALFLEAELFRGKSIYAARGHAKSSAGYPNIYSGLETTRTSFRTGVCRR